MGNKVLGIGMKNLIFFHLGRRGESIKELNFNALLFVCVIYIKRCCRKFNVLCFLLVLATSESLHAEIMFLSLI